MEAVKQRPDILSILEACPFFSGLGQQYLRTIAKYGELVQYPGGQAVYQYGEPATDFFVLIDGHVRFDIAFLARRTSIGEINIPGDVFGWTGLVESIPRRLSTARCLRATEVVRLDGATLLMLAHSDHELGYYIFKRLSEVIPSTVTSFASG
jgi:CRP-like cAMP-binding protein